MRKTLFLVISVFPLLLFGQNDKEMHLFSSLYGTTGSILTSHAYTVGKFKGNVGVFENFSTDFEDNLIFNFGVHENIEVGIQSEIPTHPDPSMNFLFKIRANEQGSYLGFRKKWIPTTAFGIHRNNAFAVASYDFDFLQWSLGYNFSDDRQGLFSNLNIPIKKIAVVQLEYVDDKLAAGLRCRYKGITSSIIYFHNLKEKSLNNENAYWEVSYHF